MKDGNTIVSTVTYEYNAQLQVSKETTSYDLSQNLYSVKEYEYDKFNNVTVTRDYGTGSTPATTVAEYDLLSRKTAEYAPNYSADKSHGSLTTYYPDGNKKSETDAEGNITSYVYDAYGQVIKKTNPDGTMNLTAYDGLQREKATYFLGSENGTKQILTKTSYEFAGYNFDIYSALDTSASHSCKGLKTTKTTYITENKQVISETLTDIKEHTIYEKTNGETKRTSAYYANGQLARQTDALGNITKYEYGYLNKVTKTYTPFNTKSDGSVNYSVTENQYDKNGNVTLAKQTVQKQDSDTVKYSVTENQYNAQGLLTQVTLSDGTSNGEKNITKYFYNNAGIQTKMYTGLNSTNDSDYMTTNYEYDAWGHLVRTTDSTGYNSGATTYDLNGNALTVTDANGNVTTNTYDALNRVLTANTVCSDTSKNVSKSYVYDNMGRVRSKTANGVQTSYQYDSLGRVYQELSPKSFKGYFYEGVSQYAKEQLVGINHQTMYSSTQYEYDAEMRIAQVKESGNLTATYTYDANGNKVSETLANGVVSTYTYNGCNKITKLVTKSGNSTISEYEYSYYLDGSDACKVRNESGIIETTSYDYDGLKRLTKESISNGKTADTYSYEYDDYGNRSKMVANGSEEYETVYDYTVNGKYTALLQKEIKTVEETSNATISDGLAISPTDLITSTAADAKTEETAYSYDANGNQITKTAEGKTETNTYDGLNQLIGFTDGETTASYKYNADGLRTSKTIDGKTINHIWDGNKQIVVDMDDSDWYSAEVYVRGTNLLAKFSKQSGNVKTDYQYYTQNAHGDVVNLTDEDGAVTKSYTYDAFGVEVDPNSGDVNAFRFCGEYFDTETGTIYLRARYYQASIGRFISRDSYKGKNTDPLSLNLYTYCYNNPIIYTDPSGHKISDLLKPIFPSPTPTPKIIDPNCVKDVYQKVVRPTWEKAEPYVKSTVGKIMTSQKQDVDKIQNWMTKHSFTYSKGGVANISLGNLGISGSFSRTIDSQGNIARQCTLSGSAGVSGDAGSFSGFSLGSFRSISNAPSYKNLEEFGFSIGGSYLAPLPNCPVLGIGGGKDIDIIPSDKYPYIGITSSTLIGTPGFEGHGSMGFTVTTDSYNIFDEYNEFYESVMTWVNN